MNVAVVLLSGWNRLLSIARSRWTWRNLISYKLAEQTRINYLELSCVRSTLEWCSGSHHFLACNVLFLSDSQIAVCVASTYRTRSHCLRHLLRHICILSNISNISSVCTLVALFYHVICECINKCAVVYLAL